MRAQKPHQHIVFKRIFTFFLVLTLSFTFNEIKSAYAQEEGCSCENPGRIVFHGDSIAQGMFNNASGLTNGVPIVDAATSGASFSNGYEGVPTIQPGDVVIISYGANDVAGTSTAQFKANLKARVEAIQAQGGCVILLGTSVGDYPGFSAATESKLNNEFNQAIREVAAETGSSYASSSGPGLKAGDNLHYTGAGYQELVNRTMGAATNSECVPPAIISDPPPPPPDPDLCEVECDACKNCPTLIHNNHVAIRAHVTSEFEQHRNWIVTTYFTENILPAMMKMSEQFATNMMQQVQIIGGFFDAKHQLETQRLFQQMTAKAHKDYHPSEGLCEIGTNIRSLASSERKSNLGQVAFANRMMQRQLLSGDNISTEGDVSDRRSRLNIFIKDFCNKNDNGGGLGKVCEEGGKNPKQINMDVDYTSAIENKLTLEVDFTKDKTDKSKITDDEENVFALSTNLFGNEILSSISDILLADTNNVPSDIAHWYLDLRAIAAKRSVAQNSFAAITAMKAQGDEEVAPFLKAILAESGVNPQDVEERLGEKPSYFAQMEVMTKDLYQNPKFYSNLYDKPANIERKGAALQAIELMQDRDIYKSLLRSEAVLAVLLETLLRKEHDRVANEIGGKGLEATPFTGDGG